MIFCDSLNITLSFHSLFNALCAHYVITIASAICTGGHFYCSTTMTHTAASKVLSFLMENTITNTQHYRSQHLLQLQVVHHFNQFLCRGTVASGFPHLGYNLERFMDWHSFVMLHVMAALGPALDLRFYPSHQDWDQATEYDCLMMGYARGAALQTMSYLGGVNSLRISIPGFRQLLDANEYFEDVLLKQAVIFVHVFDAAQAENTRHFSKLGNPDRPHLIRMLCEALGHRQQLVTEFETQLKGLKPHRPKTSILAVPLPPEGAKTIRTSRMTCGITKSLHNSEALIRLGLTPTLHPTLRRYHQDVVVVKKEQKERGLQR
jgi:hypothetical protein